MKRAAILFLVLAGVILWVACDSPGTTEPLGTNPSFAISDANHGGTSNFYWLPPLVAPADYSGTFIGTLSPEVRICDWTIQDPSNGSFQGCGSQDWTFLRTDGPAGHRVGVDVNGQHYHVNWDTKAEGVTAQSDTKYRVSVLLAGVEIGFIDIHFGATGQEAKNLKTEDIVPLNDGRTLPIKFRIGLELCEADPGLCMEIWDLSFQSNKDGGEDPLNFDIFLIDSETGAMANITQDPALDATANWHPDGDLIVFASDRADPGGHPDLYTMNPDGSNVQFLIEDAWEPEYSPDGNMIAFHRGWPPRPCWDGSCEGDGDPNDPTGRQHDIWVLDLLTGFQTQLTDIREEGWLDLFEDFNPSWHPTKPWLTFARYRNTLPDGDGTTSPDQLDDDECRFNSENPQAWWDDSGNYCAFDLVSVDVSDIGNPVWIRHTYQLFRDYLGPKWSPDGEILTATRYATDGFLVARQPVPELFSEYVDVGTFREKFLTKDCILQPSGVCFFDGRGTGDGDISWSPGGDFVLFSSERSGDLGIYSAANWGDWLLTGNAYSQEPFVVIPGKRADWARFRPF